MRRMITAEDIIGLDPCYSEEQVWEAVPRPLTVLEFLRSEHIPFPDRAWVLYGLELLDNIACLDFFIRVVEDFRSSHAPRSVRLALGSLVMSAETAFRVSIQGDVGRYVGDLRREIHYGCRLIDAIKFDDDRFMKSFCLGNAFYGNPHVFLPHHLSDDEMAMAQGIAENAYAKAWINMLEREGE